MLNIFRAYIAAIFLAAGVLGQTDSAKFKYRTSASFPVGTVLHYLKTNIDGSKPEHVSQFIASPDRIEAFKFHPKESPAGLVIAEMDWKTFSAKSLTSWRVVSKDDRKLFGTITFGEANRRGIVAIGDAKPETFAIGRFPAHLYNFDLASLNFAFPHLLDPTSAFVIGIADPTFRDSGPPAEYKGEVTVAYKADERRNNVATRKYRIDGPGLQNRGGFIWVNKRRGWIEDIEIALPDNPNWKDFKLKLVRHETMSRAEWDRFVLSQF